MTVHSGCCLLNAIGFAYFGFRFPTPDSGFPTSFFCQSFSLSFLFWLQDRPQAKAFSSND
jgi:hypothetical protein